MINLHLKTCTPILDFKLLVWKVIPPHFGEFFT